MAAQFCLKSGMQASRAAETTGLTSGGLALMNTLLQPAVMLGFLFYGLGALIWLAVLREWDVSKAYPLVGLGFVATLLVGFMLGEQVGAVRLTGVLLIALGVLLVSRT